MAAMPGPDHLARLPAAYFAAVDRQDLEATLAFFAPDAVFSVATAFLRCSGLEEVRGMFERFFADYEHIQHDITNLVVDLPAGRVATEQSCPHVKTGGVPDHVVACNQFRIGDDGRFTSVTVWIDTASPLRR